MGQTRAVAESKKKVVRWAKGSAAARSESRPLQGTTCLFGRIPFAVSWSSVGVAFATGIAVLVPHFLRKEPQGIPCTFGVARSGSRVFVRIGGGADGTVLDNDREAYELDFVVGEAEETAHLDAVVMGMSVGETRTADAGFGERKEDWVVQYDRSVVPQKLEVGMAMDLQGSSAHVVSFNDTDVTLDFNHPLAGQNASIVATLLSCEEPLNKQQALLIEHLNLGDNFTFPKAGDNVSVHCIATFASSGKTFFSSRENGAPYKFQLGGGQVIQGLDIGIKNVSLGGRALINIPAELAYGRKSSIVDIPLGKDVIFDIELLGVN